MNKRGTIYVVVPAYNVEKFIHVALDSLLKQTYKNWICLCMNDGSTDDTYKIMKQYARKDKRIQIFTQSNKGLTKTLNVLLNKVRGPYLAYLDADDAIHPQMFELLMRALTENHADVAECSAVRFIDALPEQAKEHLHFKDLRTELLTDMSIFLSHKTSKGAWINKWNKIYRWDKVKEVRFSEELTHEDDYFYNSIVNNKIQRKILVKYPFYFYRHNPSSLCGNVNWIRYQQSGLNRIRLSWENFIKTNQVPVRYQKAFAYDLANDAYRMILRKPLKKGKKDRKQIFNVACVTLRKYIKDGVIETKYLSLMQRVHMATYFILIIKTHLMAFC